MVVVACRSHQGVRTRTAHDEDNYGCAQVQAEFAKGCKAESKQ